MDDILLMLIGASLLTFGAGILYSDKRGLGWFCLIISACALIGVLQSMADLGEMFVITLMPLVFIILVTAVRICTLKE